MTSGAQRIHPTRAARPHPWREDRGSLDKIHRVEFSSCMPRIGNRHPKVGTHAPSSAPEISMEGRQTDFCKDQAIGREWAESDWFHHADSDGKHNQFQRQFFPPSLGKMLSTIGDIRRPSSRPGHSGSSEPLGGR